MVAFGHFGSKRFLPVRFDRTISPLSELLWVFLVMAPTALLVLGILGNRSPMLYQSRIRTWLGGVVAPIDDLSVVALVLFALENPGWSRLIIFRGTS